MQKIKNLDSKDIVYIDESGIDTNSTYKQREWVHRNKTHVSQKSGKFYERLNVLAGLNGNNSIAPMVFNGHCNSEIFNCWVEQFLIPELKPGQTVIMDNASFHKSPKTRQMIEQFGCKVVFLPPYSPDLNPIEKFWANMKRWIRGKFNQFKNLYDAFVQFFAIR